MKKFNDGVLISGKRERLYTLCCKWSAWGWENNIRQKTLSDLEQTQGQRHSG